MKQQQSQIYTNLWVFPLAIPIISGAGRILGEQGLLELGMVTYWIFRTPFRLTEHENETVLEISPTSFKFIEDVSEVPEDESEH